MYDTHVGKFSQWRICFKCKAARVLFHGTNSIGPRRFKYELAEADLQTDVKVTVVPNVEGLNDPPYIRRFNVPFFVVLENRMFMAPIVMIPYNKSKCVPY